MRTGPLFDTTRFDIPDIHNRPTTPAPPPSDLLTEREYDQLEEDEIDIALDSLECDTLDEGWFEPV